MKRREFLMNSTMIASGMMLSNCTLNSKTVKDVLRTAHIGVGNMGLEDLKAISSHASVEVIALCDVDSNYLKAAHALYPKAKVFVDYRVMLSELKNTIDAVIVSTPDHTHAPASLEAMKLGKAVYCQKPLTHHVSEARAMNEMAKSKNLVTQMGIQVHSFYDYKLATQLIQAGCIGKVKTVHAWSPKNWGYDGPKYEGADPIPDTLDWNLWLGTAPKREYKEGVYHPGNWRKIIDYGCGTLGDMGVHIFDTPYNALALDVPHTIRTDCRASTGFGFPEKNVVTYAFPGTKYTVQDFKWIWYDGDGAPNKHPDLKLPGDDVLPEQGAMFVGEKGNLLLPHFQVLPQLIVEDTYQELDMTILKESERLVVPVRDYAAESPKHYHQFVDACLGKDECTAPFSYAARLTETILLGVIAGRFPNQTLHWNAEEGKFDEEEANAYLDGEYRVF